MKRFTLIFAVCIASIGSVAAQDANEQKTQIKTSAVCKMCKAKIERELSFEKGIKSAVLDVPSQVVTVTYNAKKTDVEKIKKAITLTGYDAEEMPADQKAYNKLDDCCKKDQGVHTDND